MMTERILPATEYGRLEGTETAAFVPLLRPDGCIVVVEDDGQIVAAQALQPVLHAEGCWIRADHRKHGGAGRRLWRVIRSTVRDRFGVKWFFTAAADDEMRGILDRLGARSLPEHFVVSVGDK